ncbi:MAG: phytanoyl-CoA dioxygenase family protein [Woeseiaceae bacterium]
MNCFFDQLFVKEPGCEVPTPWHHDLPYWPLRGNQICSIWAPFDPVTSLSSGLEFIRGSHRWPQNFKPQAITKGAIDAEESGLEDMPDIEAHRDEYDIVSWDMAPGDLLLFHGRVVHGAGGNASVDTRRRAISTRWAGDDIRWDPRPGTLRLLWEPDLQPGAPLGGTIFPRIAPRSLDKEGPDEFAGPEMPDESRLDALRAKQAKG